MLEAASQPQTSVSAAPPPNARDPGPQNGDGAKGERGDDAANGSAGQEQKDTEDDVKMEER